MQLVKTQNLLRQALTAKAPQSLAFVPTMGALHQGHLSLVAQAALQHGTVVVSIFVNPTQFNNREDLAKYPRTLPADVDLLSRLPHDILLYAPAADDLYPQGTDLTRPYQLGNLETVLEGAHRPGHFQGVCQVVDLLLEAVQPQTLFLGQKDFQQCMVVADMMRQCHPTIELQVGATVRESSGLAMSSRNQRLSEQEKDQATVLYRTLSDLRNQLQQSVRLNADQLSALLEEAQQTILGTGFSSIDYLSLCRQQDLSDIAQWPAEQPSVLLVAATLGGVRLIDNVLV